MTFHEIPKKGQNRPTLISRRAAQGNIFRRAAQENVIRRAAQGNIFRKAAQGNIFRRAPDTHQKRDGLVPTAGTRYTPEEGWTSPDIRPQIYSRRGMDCPRHQAPDSLQKRDGLSLTSGPR